MVFKKDFLWGGDISATQIEGAWNVDGKSPTEPDYYLGGNRDTLRYAYYRDKDGKVGKVMQYSGQLPKGAKYILKDGAIYPNHFASGFYDHYKEDIALLAEMGFKALNLTVSWARILPNGIKGGVNPKGVEFYRNVLVELKKYNIKPIVLLYKYDMPAFYVEELGGWSNRRLIEEYKAFAEICLREFEDLVEYWVTFNEINVLIMMNRLIPNGTHEDRTRSFVETHNQLVASAEVIKLGHEINSNFKIGCMVAGMVSYPLTSNPADVLANQRAIQDGFYYFSDVIVRGQYGAYAKNLWKREDVEFEVSEEDKKLLNAGKADFLAFSYYMSNCTSAKKTVETTGGNLALGAKNPYLKESEWGWAIDPDGLKYFLKELSARYDNLPLMIVENGLGAVDKLEADGTVHDQYRIDYLSKHIKKMGEAIEEGVNLIAYTMWSSIDLISFSTGEVRKRYGFIYDDVNDEGNGSFKRYKKDSFYWYKKIIATNAKEL